MPARFAVQEMDAFLSPANTARETRYHQADHPATFEIFRTERVSLTSILFSGDDWRWRFRSAMGTILVYSEGYSSEAACRAAVTALQNNAGAARIVERAQC